MIPSEEKEHNKHGLHRSVPTEYAAPMINKEFPAFIIFNCYKKQIRGTVTETMKKPSKVLKYNALEREFICRPG